MKHKKELESEIEEIRQHSEGKKMSHSDRGKLGMATRKKKSIDEMGDEHSTFEKAGRKAGHTRHKHT